MRLHLGRLNQVFFETEKKIIDKLVQEEAEIVEEEKSTNYEEAETDEEEKSTHYEEVEIVEEEQSTDHEEAESVEEEKSTDYEEAEIVEEEQSTDHERIGELDEKEVLIGSGTELMDEKLEEPETISTGVIVSMTEITENRGSVNKTELVDNKLRVLFVLKPMMDVEPILKEKTEDPVSDDIMTEESQVTSDPGEESATKIRNVLGSKDLVVKNKDDGKVDGETADDEAVDDEVPGAEAEDGEVTDGER